MKKLGANSHRGILKKKKIFNNQEAEMSLRSCCQESDRVTPPVNLSMMALFKQPTWRIFNQDGCRGLARSRRACTVHRGHSELVLVAADEMCGLEGCVGGWRQRCLDPARAGGRSDLYDVSNDRGTAIFFWGCPGDGDCVCNHLANLRS